MNPSKAAGEIRPEASVEALPRPESEMRTAAYWYEQGRIGARAPFVITVQMKTPEGGEIWFVPHGYV